MRLPRSLAVLANDGFRRLYAAYCSSLLGDGIVTVALAFAVLELGGSPTQLGLVLATRGVVFVASLLAGGVVADRVRRRNVMIAADLVRTISQSARGGPSHQWPRAHW